MKKLYIVYSSNKESFDYLVDYVGARFSNIVKLDSIMIRFNNIIPIISNHVVFKHASNTPLFNFTEKINNELDKKYDNTFNLIQEAIKNRDSERKLIFIRVNDLKIITKLKRFYKRDKYITIKIDNQERMSIKHRIVLDKYQFDVIMNNVNKEILHGQVVRTVKYKVPSINYINKK